MPRFEKMSSCRWIDVRDKHGGLLTKVSEAILIQFLSVMERSASRIDPPRDRICDGDCCSHPARSVADIQRFLCKKHRRPWSIVLTDQPPDAESRFESYLAASLFGVASGGRERGPVERPPPYGIRKA